MKVLVTGGAGYIGTSLIPQLLEAGHHVRVFDNLMFGGDQLLGFFQHPNFDFIKGDIRDRDEVAAAVKGQDAIIHLAAIVGYPACRKDPVLAEEVNVLGTKNLASVICPEQLAIIGSTGSNYGAVEDICTEDTPLNPLSLYGQTKTIAEKHLLEKLLRCGLSVRNRVWSVTTSAARSSCQRLHLQSPYAAVSGRL